MLLTGYHGTNQDSAHKIIQSGKYNISHGNKEWLGDGIYFYEKFSDAISWRGTNTEKTVLHSVIEVDDDSYLDIDSEKGTILWREILDHICKNKSIILTGSSEEKQCAVCRMIWRDNPDLMVLASSFPTMRTTIMTLIDKRIRRREFCVRDNRPIRCTQIINYRG